MGIPFRESLINEQLERNLVNYFGEIGSLPLE
jgi:hypothetical protein